MPDFTQNFNRYSYALNNPLRYTDESGEFALTTAAVIGIVIASAAIIGGTINLVSNWDNIDGFWQGAAVFGAGALYGGGMAAVGIYSGGIGWMALAGAGLGGLNSFTNSIVSQTGKNFSGAENIDWKLVGASTASGVASGAVTGAVAPALASSSTLVNGISSPILRSLVVSPLVSGAVHVVGGTTFNLCTGQNFAESFNNSLDGLWQSMAIGAGMGVVSTTVSSLVAGVNPLNGKSMPSFTLKEVTGTATTFDRPEITDYHNSLDVKTDLYHNFPYLYDEYIIQNGIAAQRIMDHAFMFSLDGSINGVQGVFTVGINQQGVVFHRCFIPL
ncbi:MAG: hypothetical protein NC115_01920 [Bacteroidales bacterium]|nr:hypothetical protein [Bacteroidales bacterium]